MEKTCLYCGSIYLKGVNQSVRSFLNRSKYCSSACCNMSKIGKGVRTTPDHSFIEDGELCRILIVDNKGIESLIIIDTYLLPDFLQNRWRINNHGYVLASSRNGIKNFALHHLVLPRKKGLYIDHINRNKLDNRKLNLRYTTNSQNMMNNNSRGIFWNTGKGKWHAKICVNYKNIHLGYYDSEREALLSRYYAEVLHFGQYCNKAKWDILLNK